ncbi:ATPase family associated with various cellular activities (AAA) domain-containing protein [Sarocladium implicatum]|nr:ATPase family associated with various cellular activities (AAA) domain-containing protein [Sarocladium implicatum]
MANMTVNSSDFMNNFLSTASRASPLMQGFLFLYRILEQRFGFDPSLVLTVLGLAWGTMKMATQIYMTLMVFIDAYLRSSITVTENDAIYDHLMKWMSMHPSVKNDRDLMAQTDSTSAWESNNSEDLTFTDGGDDFGQNQYLNFSNQAARSLPRYVPAMGATRFWHNGTYFRFTRKKDTFINTSGFGGMKDLEELKVSCYGRSVRPLKVLLAEAKALYFEDTHQRTTIYRPRAKEYRRDYNMWQLITSRPVRPMRTVVLDAKEKHEVLADINEYLHPSTPAWYASRGIPLRRGYLFHGPPGTGKTSFSFALAGVFGIDIYVISLQDVNVTEEDLAALFAKLPRRCIVLLEDIDSAGLKRSGDSDDDKKGKKDKDMAEKTQDEDAEKDTEKDTESKKLTNGETKKTDDTKAEDDDKTKKRKKKKDKKSKRKSSSDSDSDDSSSSSSSSDESAKKRKKSRKMRKKRVEKGNGRRGPNVTTFSMETISLSGLLNAIDGVASHEGRVLIMTTNKPESLDEALVRPGRVDLQVGFTNASRVQAVDLFVRMYEAQPPKELGPGLKEKTKEEGSLAPGELKRIAQEFGEMVPEGSLSPAEIQGFLLKRKKSPKKALGDAPEWIEATMKQKESKSKVKTVQ